MKTPHRNSVLFLMATVAAVTLMAAGAASCGQGGGTDQSTGAIATTEDRAASGAGNRTTDIGGTTNPAPSDGSTGSGLLEISDSYPLFKTKMTIGSSLTASPGKVWLGTLTGTIEQMDTQSGAFERTIALPGGGDPTTVFPVMKLAFEGDYLWAWGNQIVSGRARPYLFAVDSSARAIVHQWDLDSAAWLEGESRVFPPEDFGVSPGKLWIDNHVVDTQTLEVTAGVHMPAMTRFAYDGEGWMWMTGDTGQGDSLVFVSTDDPSQARYQSRWPFLDHSGGSSGVGPSSPLVAAGDRMWIGQTVAGTNPFRTLAAYWANMDLLMEETAPLASVPLPDDPQKCKLFSAGDCLWVLWTGGEQAGFLYQLDPQTGATVNSLDLVGDEGRSISDVPMDIASEGGSLWILTSRQLLRLELP